MTSRLSGSNKSSADRKQGEPQESKRRNVYLPRYLANIENKGQHPKSTNLL